MGETIDRRTKRAIRRLVRAEIAKANGGNPVIHHHRALSALDMTLPARFAETLRNSTARGET